MFQLTLGRFTGALALTCVLATIHAREPLISLVALPAAPLAAVALISLGELALGVRLLGPRPWRRAIALSLAVGFLAGSLALHALPLVPFAAATLALAWLVVALLNDPAASGTTSVPPSSPDPRPSPRS